jgi:hypothetical protein
MSQSTPKRLSASQPTPLPNPLDYEDIFPSAWLQHGGHSVVEDSAEATRRASHICDTVPLLERASGGRGQRVRVETALAMARAGLRSELRHGLSTDGGDLLGHRATHPTYFHSRTADRALAYPMALLDVFDAVCASC